MGIPSSGSSPFYLRASSTLAAFSATNTNFFYRNSFIDSSDNPNPHRNFAVDDYTYKSSSLGKVQGSLLETINGLTEAKDSFNKVKGNVARIKELVEGAHNGTITGTALDDAQIEINSLISQINDITKNTQLNGKVLFDGKFTTTLATGTGANDKYTLSFSDPGSSLKNLTEIDSFTGASNGSSFGEKIRTTEDYLIISSSQDDANGFDTGKVFVYDRNNNNNLLYEFTADNPDIGMNFGVEIEVKDNLLVVGASSNGPDNSLDGRLYGFDLSTGNQIFRVDNPDPNNEYHSFWGRNWADSITITNDSILVGWSEYSKTPLGGNPHGAIYKFDLLGNFLNKTEGAAAGLRLNVGAEYNGLIYSNRRADLFGSIEQAGAINVFNPNTGAKVATINSPNPQYYGRFGQAMAQYGKYLLIGETGNDNNGDGVGGGAYESANGFTGKAYLYNMETSQFEREFTANDLTGQEEFGSSIAMTGNYVAIGAKRSDAAGTNAGAVYVFDFETGEQLYKVTPTAGALNFGNELAIEGDQLYIGAPGSSSNQGKVMQYDLLSGLSVSSREINLNTNTVTEGSLGAFATYDIGKMAISTNIQNNFGLTGTVSIDDVNNLNAMTDNLTRMTAILDGALNRLQNEYDRVGKLKTEYLDIANFIDNLGVQSNASPNKASNLLP